MTRPTPAIVLATLAGVGVNLGLAIFARGGIEAFFAHPALTALVIATIVMSVVAMFSGGNLSAGLREDRTNRWVLPVFAAIGILDSILPPWSDRIDWFVIDGDATRWTGIALFLVGGLFRLWPVFTLGHRFSGLVAIQPNHALETGGLFRIVRNPSYLGLILQTLGWGVAFRAGIGVVLAGCILPPLLARIRSEEALLREQFGVAYDAFCARNQMAPAALRLLTRGSIQIAAPLYSNRCAAWASIV
jgi:protein-S-isoprenylcysteine O-methyltransferase Ste14